MSYHRLSVKPLNVTLNTLLKRAAHVGLGVGAFTPILALANPTGGQVVAGQATIATPNANSLMVHQASQAAIINWQQFSIGQGQYVQFLQPSSSSVVLNRVVGGNASSILGSLNANGQVFLVNPNGIFFGKSASLDVQGIVASTLAITNSDFLTRNYVFQKGTGAANASVVNQGSISTHNGGYVVLAGDYAENDGIIQAKSGHVVLAGGARTTLTLSGNSLVNFAVNSATLAQLAGVSNTGSLIADGGTVVMTADVANALKATVVNNAGLIEAHAINSTNGTITLTATGGNLVNSGTLDADAGRLGQVGGDIVLKADGVTDLTNTSRITAQGDAANGGSLEVSGHTINVRGAATLGKGGNMLLDPGTMSIVGGTASANSPGETGNHSSVGHITKTFIQNQLDNGANVTISAANLIKAAGSVHSISAVATKAATTTLALKANGGNIQLSGVSITVAGALTASFANASFGLLQAKSAAFTANNSTGFLKLHAASANSHGVVTKNSLKTTGGDVTITGKTNVEGSGSNMYAIQATGNVNLGSAHIGNLSSVAEMGITLVGKSVTDTGGIDVGSTVNVTATAGAVTLGDISAFNNVTVAATGGNLTVGAVLTHNAGDNIILSDTTGNLTAGQIEAGGALTVTDVTGNVHLGDIAAYGGAVAVTDTTGNMTVGIVSGHGVNLNDGAHVLSFDHSAGSGNATVFANGALSLKAATIQTAGDELFLKASSAGAITVRGAMNLPNKDLVIDEAEGGTISLDHNVAARNVTLEGGHLAFIGAGPNFSISAAKGNLVLDTSIGTASAGVKYNVNLKDTGYGIFIEKDIFTGNTAGALGANLTATQTGHSGSSRTLHGVLVDNANGVTVLVAGSITLKGWDVGVGHVISGGPAASGSIQVKALKNITFSASGSYGGNGGNVAVQAHDASASNSKKNNAVVVQAGGNLKLAGKHVDIKAGSAHAFMSSNHANGSASANANVSLKAGGNVTLIGAASNHGGVSIEGGHAVASGGANNSHSHAATANANVSITSTKGNIAVSGHQVNVSGGSKAVAEAFASGEAGTMTANANANVALSAKGTITLAAGSGGSSHVRLRGGKSIGHDGYGDAHGGNETASATAHGDVSLTAAGIVLTGAQVDVSAGYGAGRQSSITLGDHIGVARASNGTHAIATYTATANVNLTAGVGGIAITGSGEGGSVHIHGGTGEMLYQTSASADGPNSKATAIASARVNITDTGAFTALTNGRVDISAGRNVARYTLAQGNEGGSAALTGDGGISINAAAITIGSAGGHSAAVEIAAGTDIASHGKATASGSYGGATLTGLSSVSMTATGALKISAKNNVFIGGGSQGAFLASASGHGHGKAAVNAGAAVSLQGGSVRIASANQGISIDVGYGVAGAARAHASYGSAAVTAAGGISITATTGNMVLSAKQEVNVRGGRSAAAGIPSGGHSFDSGTTGFGSHGSVKHIHHHITNSYSYASATARGLGASALVSGAAGVSLTANKGTLTIAQTNTGVGSVSLSAGEFAARRAHAQASNGASATVSGNAALSISAGNLTVTGHRVSVQGGGDAARGASSGQDSHKVVGQRSSGAGLHSFTSGTATSPVLPKVDTAKGSGAIAKVSGDGSVTLKGGTVSLTATGGSLDISAGYGGGSRGRLKASSGGHASISAKTGVGITATVAFIATEVGGSELAFNAGGSAGRLASVNASGSGAKALLNTDDRITLSAPTVSLSAPNMQFRAGIDGGSFAKVHAGSSGSADMIVNGGVTITATKAFTAVNTNGNTSLEGGFGAGRDAVVSATGSSAKATLSVNDDVSITAGASGITLTGVNNIEFGGGGGALSGAHVTAVGSSAQATATASARVNLVTTGNITVGGNAFVDIRGGEQAARGATVKGGSSSGSGRSGQSGAATLHADAGVGFTAANIIIGTAGHTTGIDVGYGSNGASEANAQADHRGTAALNAVSQVQLTATGAVAMNAVGGITLVGGFAIARGAEANADSGGSAALTATGGAGITAGGTIKIATTGVNGSIQLLTNGDTGYGAVVTADASGAKASLNAHGDISLQGNAVRIAAANNGVGIDAGYGVARNAFADANSGQATLKASANINITTGAGGIVVAAKNGISVAGGSAARGHTFAGSASSSRPVFFNNSQSNSFTRTVRHLLVDYVAATAQGSGAVANLTGSATVNLTATKNGGITLDQTNTVGGSLRIAGGSEAAASAFAFASKGGNAALTGKTGVTISGGAVTLVGHEIQVLAGGNTAADPSIPSTHSNFGEHSGASFSGQHAGTGHAPATATSAHGFGAKATRTGDGSVTITGTSVSLTANGGGIQIETGYGAGAGAHAHASSGASAAVTANDQIAIAATTGALTMAAAGGNIVIGHAPSSCCGSFGIGKGASASAAGGNAKATVTLNSGFSLAGATAVTLTAGHNLTITATSGPSDAGAVASFTGKATLTANLGTSLVTAGAFTAVAGASLEIFAGRGGPSSSSSVKNKGDYALANRTGAVATFASNGSLNITANTVALTGNSEAGVEAGRLAGWKASVSASNGATANFTGNRNVNITTKGSVSLTLAGRHASGSEFLFLGAEGGAGEGAQVNVGSHGGKATLTDTGNLNINAGGNIILNAGAHKGAALEIFGGSGVGAATGSSSQVFAVKAHRGGSANANLSGNVNLTAKGAIVLTAGVNGNIFVTDGGHHASSASIGAVSGGKATGTVQSTLNLNAAAITLTAGNNITITAASEVAKGAVVQANSAGIATLNVQTGTAFTTKGALTVVAGGNLLIKADGLPHSHGTPTPTSASLGAHMHVLAATGSSAGANLAPSNGAAHATFTGTDTLQITAASVSLTAAGVLGISAGSGVASEAVVYAQTRNDKATLTADAGLKITATGTISMVAGGELNIRGGGKTGHDARASAGTLGSLTGGSCNTHGTACSGSPSSHRRMPGANHANASMTLNAGINLKAGGAFTAIAAGGVLDVSNGSSVASGLHVFADGQANVAKATVTGGVNITAGSIALTGAHGLGIFVNSAAGNDAQALALSAGQATLVGNDGINLSATGAITLTANTGDIRIQGGSGAFVFAPPKAFAGSFNQTGSQAVATLQLQSGVNIHAGSNLVINAKRGGIQVSGGYGDLASVQASAGSANVNIDASVNISAIKNVTMNAGGGDLSIRGGGAQGIIADVYSSSRALINTPAAGVVQGDITTGVSVTAGSNVTLAAHGDVTVAAGAGETLVVGEFRRVTSAGSAPTGAAWVGGSANLSDDLSATVTAGKNLTVSAGTGTGGSGNIVVQGLGTSPNQNPLGFVNTVSVRGGSSGAVASLALTANATLTAGSNIVLNAARVATVTGPTHKGNLSIEGGSLSQMRADHTLGNVTLTGSADAGLVAGNNVVFNAIGGSVNVFAAGGSDNNEKLIDAHGNSGNANVTGHMDASVTAGNDIVTVTALGGGLNVMAGQIVSVVAIGAAGGLQQADGTADASLTAGDVITISAGGDLNVFGGRFDTVEASIAGVGNTRRAVDLQAKSSLNGANGVTLTFAGDGVIAGGDNNTISNGTPGRAVAGFSVLDANADTSTTISGKNIAITVGGNLLVRGGASNAIQNALFGSENSATFTLNANVNLTAAQNLTVNVGKGAVGTASFVGGNIPTAKVIVEGFFGSPSSFSGGNRATANLNADVNVKAGGNISMNVHGNLNVAGGAGVGASGFALAGSSGGSTPSHRLNGDGGVATANLSAKTTFTAGGAIAIAMHGGHAVFAGGGQAGSNAFVQAATDKASSAANASYNLVSSLTMKAGGAFTLTGAAVTPGGVTVTSELFADSFEVTGLFASGNHANLSLKDDGTVTLTGATLSINGGHFSTVSADRNSFTVTPGTSSYNKIIPPASPGSVPVHGTVKVSLNGTITILSGSTPVSPLSVHSPLSVSARTLDITRETLMVAPQESGTSFGGMRSLSELPTVSPTPVVLTSDQVDISSGVLLQLDDTTLSLGTLQSESPVLSLVTIAAPATGDAPLVQPAATVFDPALRLASVGSSGACTALVLGQAGAYRCGAGDR